MSEALKYIIVEGCHKTTVLVPVQVWNDLNNNYRKLQNKIAVLNSIQDGLREVKTAKRNGKALLTLKEFLK